MNNNISMNAVSLCEAKDRAISLKNALIIYYTPEICRDDKIAEIYKKKATRSDILACLGINTESKITTNKIEGKKNRTYSYIYSVIPYA